MYSNWLTFIIKGGEGSPVGVWLKTACFLYNCKFYDAQEAVQFGASFLPTNTFEKEKKEKVEEALEVTDDKMNELENSLKGSKILLKKVILTYLIKIGKSNFYKKAEN